MYAVPCTSLLALKTVMESLETLLETKTVSTQFFFTVLVLVSQYQDSSRYMTTDKMRQWRLTANDDLLQVGLYAAVCHKNIYRQKHLYVAFPQKEKM